MELINSSVRSAEQPPYWLEATLAMICEIWAVAVWIDLGLSTSAFPIFKAVVQHAFEVNQTAVGHRCIWMISNHDNGCRLFGARSPHEAAASSNQLICRQFQLLNHAAC